MAIGFVVMLLAMQFNYQQLKNRRIVYGLLILSRSVCCWQCLVLRQYNGAHRWMKFPGFSIQPSELSKLR